MKITDSQIFSSYSIMKNKDGPNSIRHKPYETHIDSNGNTIDINLRIHDRNRKATKSNVKVLHVNCQTKKAFAGLLALTTIALGVGSVFCPPLLCGAVTCGIVSAALFAWSSSKPSKQDNA